MYEIYARIRDERGLTDYKVAKLTGIGQSTFSDWKNGRTKPKTSKLEKIADALGVSLDYLLTGKETINRAATVQEQELLRLFRSLTSDGRAEAIKRIREMTMVDAWTRERKKPELSIS